MSIYKNVLKTSEENEVRNTMLYKKALVYAHPRSGSHYLAALIAKNFFNTEAYFNFYGGHGTNFDSMERRVRNTQDTIFFYIWRDFESVARSIFVLRNRFGLKVDDYEKFLNTSYHKMWCPDLEVDVVRETLTSFEHINTVDNLFKKMVNRTPFDYHHEHFMFWHRLGIGYKNVAIIYYGNLTDPKYFLKTMNYINSFFSLEDRNIFINIDKKVGWMNVQS